MSRRSSRSRNSSGSSSSSKRQRGEDGEAILVEDDGVVRYSAVDDVAESNKYPFCHPAKDSDREAFNRLPAGEKSRLVGNAVKYILLQGGRGLPINLTKTKTVNTSDTPRYKRAILEAAREQLQTSFGLEICSVRNTHSTHYEKFKDYLFLMNTKGDAITRQILMNAHPDAAARRGLLMGVLALIWCEDNALNEDKLYRLLSDWDPRMPTEAPSRQLNGKRQITNKKEDVHPSLGDVVGLVDEFEEQLYILKKTKQEDGEEAMWCYELGPRAELEITSRQIVQFLNEVLKKEMDSARVIELSQKMIGATAADEASED